MIYAGAQKNVGPAGVVIAIIRDDMLGHARWAGRAAGGSAARHTGRERPWQQQRQQQGRQQQ